MRQTRTGQERGASNYFNAVMLKDDLYSVRKIKEENKSIEVIIELNEQHKIFEGHFPGQPVLPGVCIMQMTREILESFLNKKLQLLKADDIRFSSMVNPTKNKELKFILQYNFNQMPQINMSAKILNKEDVVCCKIKATYKII